MRPTEIIRQMKMHFFGSDPFDGIEPAESDEVDGWLGGEEIFDGAIANIGLKLMLEVGVWQGKTSIYAAKKMAETTDDFGIICVDTWLGSIEHHERPEWRESLLMKNGYPQIYFKFLENVVRAGMQDHIMPLPLPSTQAATYLGNHNVQVAALHIDGGHDYKSVKGDLESYWPLLLPTGILIGDDYNPIWPGVIQATDEFFSDKPEDIQVIGHKYAVQKKATGA